MAAIGRDRCPNQKTLLILNLLILLLGIPTVSQWLSIPLGNVYFNWGIDISIITCLLYLQRKKKFLRPIYVWLIFIEMGVIHGFFMAENYWDWKFLVSNFLAFHVCLVALVSSSPLYCNRIFTFWYRYGWILLLLLIPIMGSDGYGKYLSPYTLVALFFPLLNWKMKILVLIGLVLTLTLALDSRSDVLKYSLCFLIGALFGIKHVLYHSKYVVRFLHMTFLLLPFVLSATAVTGIFNIFSMQEELGIEEHQIESSDGEMTNALGDTRTFLYVEEIESAIKNNYVLFGRSLARGYDNVLFGTNYTDEMKGSHPAERASCEVNILNIFNYMGIVGCIAYFLVLIVASSLAVYKSRNFYMPILGFYVSFRWAFGFIEDFTRFDLNMLFLWAMIGMCLSPYFRNMSNRHFSYWIKTLFSDYRYHARKKNRKKVAVSASSHL